MKEKVVSSVDKKNDEKIAELEGKQYDLVEFVKKVADVTMVNSDKIKKIEQYLLYLNERIDNVQIDIEAEVPKRTAKTNDEHIGEMENEKNVISNKLAIVEEKRKILT